MSSRRPRLVIVGNGGHARVAVDVIEAARGFDIAGFTAPQGSDGGLPGFDRLGSDDDLPAIAADGIGAAFIALGDNAVRAKVYAAAEALGFSLPTIAHPSAILSPRARIGSGTIVMPGAIVNTGTTIGRGAIVNTGAGIDHDCSIGDFVHIAPGCRLAGTITVGEGSFLGIGTSVIPGVRIGMWSIVGAGAAVVSDLPDHSWAVGVPAQSRQQRKI